MKTILYVALGGALGSVIRYLVTKIVPNNWPYATFAVNVLGCLLIGYLYGLFSKSGCNLSAETRAMLTVGFCGGLTTFSTFMNDSYRMLSIGQNIQVALYLALSIFVGIIAVYFGQKLA